MRSAYSVVAFWFFVASLIVAAEMPYQSELPYLAEMPYDGDMPYRAEMLYGPTSPGYSYETVVPNDEHSDQGDESKLIETDDCSTLCSTSNCWLWLDEDDIGNPISDGAVMVLQTSTAGRMSWLFATPSNTPSTDTNAQKIRILASKYIGGSCTLDTGGDDPYFTAIRMRCGTPPSTTEIDAHVGTYYVTGTNQVHEFNFTFDDVTCAADGSDFVVDIRMRLNGIGASKRYPGIEAIEWINAY